MNEPTQENIEAVRKVVLRPGDKLVVSSDSLLSAAVADVLMEQLRAFFVPHELIMLNGGLRVTVVGPQETPDLEPEAEPEPPFEERFEAWLEQRAHRAHQLVEGWFDDIADAIADEAGFYQTDLCLDLDVMAPRAVDVQHGVRSYIASMRRPTWSTSQLMRSRALALSKLAKGMT